MEFSFLEKWTIGYCCLALIIVVISNINPKVAGDLVSYYPTLAIITIVFFLGEALTFFWSLIHKWRKQNERA